MLGSVLIVGGRASIAPEIIETFAASSRHVIVTYRNPPRTTTSNVKALTCDLECAASIRKTAAAVADSFDGVDAVLLLSGAISGEALETTTDAEMDRLVAVNLTGPARLLRELLPQLNKDARVLFVSSVAGERGSFDPLYAATKGALIPLAKSLATWLGSEASFTVVAPGAIEDSAMLHDMSAARIAYHRGATPLGELLNRVDLAQILVDLAHSHWRHSNGAVIRINGGSYV